MREGHDTASTRTRLYSGQPHGSVYRRDIKVKSHPDSRPVWTIRRHFTDEPYVLQFIKIVVNTGVICF